MRAKAASSPAAAASSSSPASPTTPTSSLSISLDPVSSPANLSVTQGLPPWSGAKVYDMNTPETSLHDEIMQWLRWAELEPNEQEMRRLAVRRVAQIVAGMDKWKQHRPAIAVYGSCRNALALRDSDIDMTLLGVVKRRQNLELYRKQSLAALQELAKVLRSTPGFKKVIVIPALVPILSFVHCGVSMDISINNVGGLDAVTTVRKLIRQYPTARPLTLLFKNFLRSRNLNEVVTGGLGSYSCLLLVVSFLQHCEREAEGRELNNLGALWVKFLQYYGCQFNFDAVGICVEGCGSLFDKQGDEVNFDRVPVDKRVRISIKDPTQATNDVGHKSFRFGDVVEAMASAFASLTSSDTKLYPAATLLSRVFSPTAEAPPQLGPIPTLLTDCATENEDNEHDLQFTVIYQPGSVQPVDTTPPDGAEPDSYEVQDQSPEQDGESEDDAGEEQPEAKKRLSKHARKKLAQQRRQERADKKQRRQAGKEEKTQKRKAEENGEQEQPPKKKRNRRSKRKPKH
eukprot:TRINITY_DN67323_c8_g1_i1.p1 TRINITY_DN67323_c8_g1~~TRINITY_DN67323_c8_g1_i1.p1  ORF type:complete len:561 (+),score=30.68 TRINITY_DN67323_c8_g1_i1:143-1684(+)